MRKKKNYENLKATIKTRICITRKVSNAKK